MFQTPERLQLRFPGLVLELLLLRLLVLLLFKAAASNVDAAAFEASVTDSVLPTMRSRDPAPPAALSGFDGSFGCTTLCVAGPVGMNSTQRAAPQNAQDQPERHARRGGRGTPWSCPFLAARRARSAFRRASGRRKKQNFYQARRTRTFSSTCNWAMCGSAAGNPSRTIRGSVWSPYA